MNLVTIIRGRVLLAGEDAGRKSPRSTLYLHLLPFPLVNTIHISGTVCRVYSLNNPLRSSAQNKLQSILALLGNTVKLKRIYIEEEAATFSPRSQNRWTSWQLFAIASSPSWRKNWRSIFCLHFSLSFHVCYLYSTKSTINEFTGAKWILLTIYSCTTGNHVETGKNLREGEQATGLSPRMRIRKNWWTSRRDHSRSSSPDWRGRRKLQFPIGARRALASRAFAKTLKSCGRSIRPRESEYSDGNEYGAVKAVYRPRPRGTLRVSPDADTNVDFCELLPMH